MNYTSTCIKVFNTLDTRDPSRILLMMVGHNYKNILANYDEDSNDFLWISRPIEFTETFKQDRPILSPTQLKLLVYNNYKSKDTTRKIHDVKSYNNEDSMIYNILSEIGYDYDLTIIRWLGYLLVKILKTSLSGLFVNEEKLTKIKSDMACSPVVFVPTHRSYADFILMAYVCFKYNINIPCVAAGMDFLSMKFMNKILRKSKAFFMRRKFSDDPVYRNVFKEYVRALITFQNSPVEFFIEGTRSRTGKSLMPKFGFLTMLADAFISGDIPDIKIIPVNISYDRLIEENLFAYELIGIPKPKESTAGLLKGLKVMNGNYGKVFINFGDPLSIREFFERLEDRRFIPNDYENFKIKEIAYKIINMQQYLQVFGSFNLLALILNSTYIRTGSHSIVFQDTVEQFKKLLDLFKQFGATVSLEDNIENSIKEAINIHSSIIELSNANYIQLKTKGNDLVSIPPVNSSYAQYMMNYIPYVMLQIYINPALNLFIRTSIIMITLTRFNEEHKISKDDLLKYYGYLCNLLKHEFVLDDNDRKEFFTNILSLKELRLINIQFNYIELLPENNFKEFFIELLLPFISGIHLIYLFLINFQKQLCDKSQQDIIKMTQSHIERQIRDGLIPYHYCTSVDFISNTINSLQEMSIISRNEITNKFLIDVKSLKCATEYVGCLRNHTGFIDQQKLHIHIYDDVRAKF